MGGAARALTALFTVVYNRNAIIKKRANESEVLTKKQSHDELDRLIGKKNPRPPPEYPGDPRWPTVIALTRELRRRGHRVLLAPVPGCQGAPKLMKMHDKTFGPYNASTSPEPDFVLNWWTYPLEELGSAAVLRAPTLYYEHGFTRGDVTVDPGGLLGDSFYVDSLNDRVEADTARDAARCDDYVAAKLASGAFSKRPQERRYERRDDDPTTEIGPESEDTRKMTIAAPRYAASELRPGMTGGGRWIGDAALPSAILGRYVFVPTQHIGDVSIERYSNLTMRVLLDRVIEWGAARAVPIVVKIHPHIDDREVDVQLRFVQAFANRYGAETYVSTASIAVLASHANLTITLNGGTIVDNFWTGSPVLTTAYSMFWKTDAVLFFDGADEARFQDVIDASYGKPWPESRKRRQRQILCWLAEHSLNVFKSPEANVAVLQYHLDNLASKSVSLGAATPDNPFRKAPRRLDLAAVGTIATTAAS